MCYKLKFFSKWWWRFLLLLIFNPVRKTSSRDIVITETSVFERFFYRHEMKNKKHSSWYRRRRRFCGGRDLSRKTHVNSWPAAAAAAEAHASQPLTTYISARVEHRCSPINHSRKPVNHYFNKLAPLPLSPQNIYTRQVHPMYYNINTVCIPAAAPVGRTTFRRSRCCGWRAGMYRYIILYILVSG